MRADGRIGRTVLGLGNSAWAVVALAFLGAILACQLLCTPGASGAVARGHVFTGAFAGTGEHVFAAPAGIAVDEATGEVYVVDAADERVERFKPDGSGGYEFVAELKVPTPGPIAVDNSASSGDPSKGDVYVAGSEEKGAEADERDFIYKFRPSGERIYKKEIFKTREGNEEFEAELEDIAGLAVDAAGGLFAYWEEDGNITGFSSEEKNRLIPSLTKEEVLEQRPLEEGCTVRPGFALSANAFYVAHERQTALGECLEEVSRPTVVSKLNAGGEAVARSLDQEDTTGVAIDAAGDVYADNEDSIAEFSADGRLVGRFGGGQLSSGGALAVDSASEQVFVAEEGKVAIFAGEEALAPPSVDSVFAQALSADSERIDAEIDPHGSDTHYYVQYGTGDCAGEPAPCRDVPVPPGNDLGSAFGDQSTSVELTGLVPNTTYHYRVLAENAHGSGSSSQQTETFFTTLPSAGQTLADHRAWELVSPPDKHGAAIEGISLEGALIQSSADGNTLAWTASAPLGTQVEGNRRPEPVQLLSGRDPSEGWETSTITTPHNKGEGYHQFEEKEYRFFSSDLSRALVQPDPHEEQLESPPLSADASEKTIYERNDASGEYQPLVDAADDLTGEPFGGKLEFLGATPDLRHVVFESQVPLLAGAVGDGLYEWSAESGLRLVSLLPGSTIPASEPKLGDGDLNVRDAISSNGQRVFWTQAGPEAGLLYMRDTTTDETVQMNAVQGEGTQEPSAEAREEGLDEVRFQGASADGSRVFFTDTWPLTSESTLEPLPEEEVVEGEAARSLGRPRDLYEFNSQTGQLVDLTVDHHLGEAADVLGTLPGFSEDGSYVYFVANGVLAPGAEPGDCPRTKPVLPHPQASCNLYVSEPAPEHPGEREARLVARLSYEDAGDWGQRHTAGELSGVLGDLTSQVSSNGRYLAFMSQRELTGYGNVDANPQANGAHDQEVFLYSAGAGRLTCASCNPHGQAPDGVYDTEEAGEGLGLLVDRPETWTGEWLAGSIPGWTLIGLTEADYQSRYLSDSGRLFFNSADALVNQGTSERSEQVNGKDTNVGVENVYEYEPGGLGSCTEGAGCVSLISSGTSEHESAFLDASEAGDDAFFMTAAPLLASDNDSAYDVYDARVCGIAEASPCLPEKPPPPPVCAGEECRPPAAAQPSFPAPSSTSLGGAGNIVEQHASSSAPTSSKPKSLTRAQKLTKALKACRRLPHRERRLACERKARRAFGAKRQAERRKTGRAIRRQTSSRTGRKTK